MTNPNYQAAFSLAIQALNERRDRLRGEPSYPGAVKECEEAIDVLEGTKELYSFLAPLLKNNDCATTWRLEQDDSHER